MSSLDRTGSLVSLYLDDISISTRTNVPEFIINGAANLWKQDGARNWIPLIVREIGADKYEAIANTFIYAAAEKAGLDRLWCIIAENTDIALEISQVLAREKIPKVNLCSASRDEIKAGLEYLIAQPETSLKGLNITVATIRIEEANRQSWQSFEPISKLKCGITKGKKLDALKQIFYLSPLKVPNAIAEATTEEKSLEKMKVTELKDEAKKWNIPGANKMKKNDLIAAIKLAVSNS